MTDKVIAYTTCGNEKEAKKLAKHLVEQRLAACVNIVPRITSYYRWQGKIENDSELLLMIKTARGLLDALRKELDKLHSYDVPELIIVPILDGAPNYLAWMEQSLTGEEER